jgi:hypothetical protein
LERNGPLLSDVLSKNLPGAIDDDYEMMSIQPVSPSRLKQEATEYRSLVLETQLQQNCKIRTVTSIDNLAKGSNITARLIRKHSGNGITEDKIGIIYNDQLRRVLDYPD